MELVALDIIRGIGWGIINFIYSLIDTLFDIFRELNSFDIINSLAENGIFKNLHSNILIISLTLFSLFIIWKFIQKILNPDEDIPINQIVKEIIICGLMIILSTFLYAQVSSFSIILSNFTGNTFQNQDTTFSNNMLSLYIDYSAGYKESDDFESEDIFSLINENSFNDADLYNEKYVTSNRWIIPDKKDYKYSIDWIMSILVGGFFLYSLGFSGIMLARRQIEFAFLFLISPIVFATSIGNKQRRSAVIEQIVSLVLQAAVVLLIINLTALVLNSVNNTTFFVDSTFKNILLKSLMFLGCGTFLLTGSQAVNRFIGTNVSSNSGREQLMSLAGFGNITKAGGMFAGGSLLASAGGLLFMGGKMLDKKNSAAALAKNALSNISNKSDVASNNVSGAIEGFSNGSNISTTTAPYNPGESNTISSITSFQPSNNISPLVESSHNNQNQNTAELPKPSIVTKVGGSVAGLGLDYVADSLPVVNNIYRRRGRYRG